MQSFRTSANSKLSMYLMPPHARFDDCWLVNDAKSLRSTKATRAPRADKQAAATAPLIPPPTTRTSWTGRASRATLAVRSEDGEGSGVGDDPERREDGMAATID